MRIRLLPSSAGGDEQRFFLSTFLVDGRIAVDAGGLGLAPLGTQREVRHVFLTHSHLDHVATLPVFLENVYRPEGPAPVVYGGAATLGSLRRDVLNDRVWPDFERLSAEGQPFVDLREIAPEAPVAVAGRRMTPVPLDHLVPTLGYLVEGDDGLAVFASDTGPTSRIWERVRERGGAGIVFLEVSFPDRRADLAASTMHLCPRTFAAEVAKLPPGTRVVAVHVKPAFHAEVAAEVRALGLPDVEVGRPGAEYEV